MQISTLLLLRGAVSLAALSGCQQPCCDPRGSYSFRMKLRWAPGKNLSSWWHNWTNPPWRLCWTGFLVMWSKYILFPNEASLKWASPFNWNLPLTSCIFPALQWLERPINLKRSHHSQQSIIFGTSKKRCQNGQDRHQLNRQWNPIFREHILSGFFSTEGEWERYISAGSHPATAVQADTLAPLPGADNSKNEKLSPSRLRLPVQADSPSKWSR